MIAEPVISAVLLRFFTKWAITALFFFLIATVLGALLRFYFIREIPGLSFRHILHAHSHLAMLGWGFTALSVTFITLLATPYRATMHYHRLLWVNVLAGAGMGIFFLFQGYGAISIAFCTLHLVAAYWFALVFLKDIKGQSGTAIWLARWGVRWMVVSTLGLWAIGPVSATLGRLHPLYFASIQFFLHFQFNGWLIFGVLAILAKWMEHSGRTLVLSGLHKALLQLSLLLTYALSITWSTPETALFYLNSLGVIFQAVAFGLIFRQVLPLVGPSKSDVGKWLLWLGLSSLLLKVAVQSSVAVPAIASISYTIRHFVIGFIHLTTLGAFTLTLLSLWLSMGLWSRRSGLGCWLLMAAFVSTELLLFGQGTLLWGQVGFMPYYHEILFACTLLFPVSLAFFLWERKRYHDNNQSLEEESSEVRHSLKSNFKP